MKQTMALTYHSCNQLYLSALYWIAGLSDRSIVRGSWTRDTPTILISAANLNNPSSLQYDVTSHRYLYIFLYLSLQSWWFLFIYKAYNIIFFLLKTLLARSNVDQKLDDKRFRYKKSHHHKWSYKGFCL